MYVYCSNESSVEVFFDNIQVVQERSKVLEETHYYPFGLTMAGISSKAATTLENRFKYNGKELQSKEFSDGSGLEMYDFGFRNYDAQIGRWHVVDPLCDIAASLSPYHFVRNNPINRVDPNGLTDYIVNGETKTIDDGHDDISMEVSAREFNRLKKRFDKGGSGYERLMNRFSVKNGFNTISNLGGGNSETGQSDNFAITYHKPGGDSYSDWSISNRDPNYSTVENIVRTTDSGLGAFTGQFGNINIGSNSKWYYRQSSGRIFNGNQHVSTVSASTKYSGLAKGAKWGGLVAGLALGAYEIHQGYVQDGGKFGYNAQVQTAGAVGGIAGGWAGAQGGAAVGAAIGAWFGGVGAVPGAIIGGLIGGAIGAWTGDYYGEQGAKLLLK